MNTSAKLLALAGLAVLVGCGGQSSSGGASTLPEAHTGRSLALGRALPSATQSPPPGHSVFPSSWSRIVPIQVFDAFSPTGTQMTNAEITADAHRYPGVWGSFNPAPWIAAKPSIQLSRYYVPEEDSNLISGHDLTWWQTNHPDWIMYACDSNNNPTMELAYVPGIGYPDVVLDIHNPAVVDYQIRQSLAPYMIANGYKAAALDQVNFNNLLVGGNPNFGQQVMPGYYGCGIYENGVFVRRYTGRNDPNWTTDILNWVATMRSDFNTDPTLMPYHLEIFTNHALASTTDPNELTLLSYIDAQLNEPGFVDYGNYKNPSKSFLFAEVVRFMEFLQAHNVASVIIDKYDNVTKVTGVLVEYAIATYLMGKEQGAYLYTAPDNGPGIGYGAEQWHYLYNTKLGAPCAEMYGGPSYDPNNPQIYYRQFANGISVVNSGSLPVTSENATLPAGKVYKDIINRKVTNPLPVASNDAYVLTTTPGTGC